MDDQCFECGSLDLVEDFGAGDLICRGCGMVLIAHLIDDTAEWNNYTEDDRDRGDQSRVGEALDERTGATSLDTFLVTARSARSAASSGTVARPHFLTQTTQVIRRQQGVKVLRDHCDALQVPRAVLDYAFTIFAKVDDAEVVSFQRQSNKDRVFAAIVYMACRDCGVPRSYKEMQVVTGVDKFKIGKTVDQITRADVLPSRGPARSKTEDFLARYCSSLDLPYQTRALATPIVEKATAMGLVEGKAPDAIAAGVIYLVAAFTNSKRSVEEVSTVTTVAASIVREVARTLNGRKKDLFADVLPKATPAVDVQEVPVTA